MSKTKKRTKTTTKKKSVEPMIVKALSFGGGITYQQRMVNCGSDRCKKGCSDGARPHGPYWYRCEHNPRTQKMSVKYHGKNEPTIEDISRHMQEREAAS